MSSQTNVPNLRPDVSGRIGSDATPSLDEEKKLDPFFRTSPRDPQAAENARRALKPAVEFAVAAPVENAAMLAHAYGVDVRLAARLLALEKKVAELTALLNGDQI